MNKHSEKFNFKHVRQTYKSLAPNDHITEKFVSPLKDDECTVERQDSQDLHCNVDINPKLWIIWNKTAWSPSP